MDLTKVLELAETAAEIIQNIRDTVNGYIRKINKILDEIQKLVNNIVYHSVEFVRKKLEFLYDKIEDTFSGLIDWYNKAVENLKAWYDEKMIAIKFSILKKINSKTGLCLPDALLNSLATSIPHPELPVPEINIELPDTIDLSNLSTDQQIEIKPIPEI